MTKFEVTIITPALISHDFFHEFAKSLHNSMEIPYEFIAIQHHNDVTFNMANAVNKCVKIASGDIVCVITDDVRFSKGWYPLAKRALETLDICGINSPYGMEEAVDDRSDGVHHDVRWLKFGVYIFKKKVLDVIGVLLDESMPLWYHDVDLGARAFLAGLKVEKIPGIGGYISHRLADSRPHYNPDRADLITISVENFHRKWRQKSWEEWKRTPYEEIKRMVTVEGSA